MDFRESAGTARIDGYVEAASRLIDGYSPGGGCLHRRFYPELKTVTFDWPNNQSAPSNMLYLNANELVSVTTLLSGGVALAAGTYFLRPDTGPPFTRVELDLSSSAAFSAGDTYQRSIAITGVYAGCALEETPAGALAEALDASETAVDVTNAAVIGVGHILRIDDERMIVTGRAMLDTTQNLVGTVAADKAVVSLSVGSGAAFAVDEVILLDAERMRITDIAGNTLVVKRAWDGSVLAAHTNSDIYAARTLTVTRGALGSTAATHDTAAAIVRHVVPGPVERLATAETMNLMLGDGSGWARTIGSGDSEREYGGRGLAALRSAVETSHGRKARLRAV